MYLRDTAVCMPLGFPVTVTGLGWLETLGEGEVETGFSLVMGRGLDPK